MKILKILLTFIILFSFFHVNAGDNDISIIASEVNNVNKLDLFFDKEIDTSDNSLSSDLKIFRDFKGLNIKKDLENNKMIELSLDNKLEKNTTYSLLAIYGAEGSIDFKINDLINGVEISGNSADGIERIKLIDENNIEIYFTKIIESDEIDIKLLKEISIDKIGIASTKKEINIYINENFTKNSEYLAMIFSLTTKENNVYNILNTIYEFKVNEISGDVVTKTQLNDLKQDKELSDIALNSAETPDTGPETWLLILATFIFSNFIYFRKKLLNKK